MQYKKNNFLSAGCFAILFCLAACSKVPVEFGSEGVSGDPNVTIIDTFTLEVSTLQADSFATKSSGYFIVGKHNDPAAGIIESKSYCGITPPTLDLSTCTNCVFDSIVLNLKLSSGFMGDTAVPFTINIHEVTGELDASDVSLGYNTSSVPFNPMPLASKTVTIRPSRKETVSIKLPDDFGKNLFRMLKTNSDTITHIDRFRRFFRGICLDGPSTNNAIFYFDKDASTGAMFNLHYTVAGATPVSKTASFTIGSDDLQFNAFSYNKTGTPLSAFIPEKKQLINSRLTNNIAYLHYNSGLFPKIKFGNLFSIKELHPYIQVLKAELEIVPVKNSFGKNTNYSLPEAVELRLTDDENYTTGSALAYSYGTQTLTQEGSLSIDYLYGENTYYTYDVTNFVNSILEEGVFSSKALIMYPSSANALSNDQRLLINNSSAGSKAIKLKLSILGL